MHFAVPAGFEPANPMWASVPKTDVFIQFHQRTMARFFGLILLATLELLNLDMNKSLKTFYFIPNFAVPAGIEPALY